MKLPNLNRRISIQSQSTTQLASGQPVQTWSTIYCCWASVDLQQSQLIYSTDQFVEKVTHRITIRWTKSQVIQPDMRIQYVEPGTGVTHTYNIEALLNPGQANVWLIALCYELDGVE
jgi:SPP1 family predicted phage head-tail adaptor